MNDSMKEYRLILQSRLKDAKEELGEGTNIIDRALQKGQELAYEHALDMLDTFLKREENV